MNDEFCLSALLLEIFVVQSRRENTILILL